MGSNSDFENTLVATEALPLLMCPLYMRWRGLTVLDGCIAEHTPLFRDNVRDQIVVDLKYVKGDFLNPTLSGIKELWAQGQRDAATLLSGRSPGPQLRFIPKTVKLAQSGVV